MLADAGCACVIVGHSERRAGHGEDDETVAAKAAAAHAAGLGAIVCVGESAAERNAGRALAVIGRQVEGSLPASATPDKHRDRLRAGVGHRQRPHAGRGRHRGGARGGAGRLGTAIFGRR